MADPTIRVGEVRPVTEALGPGRRFGLWVRGCSLRCPGCTTPRFRPTGDASSEVSVTQLMNQVRDAMRDFGIEGVSVSGGEPFEQALALTEFARQCRALGLSVLVWTGRLRHQLERSLLPGSREFLAEIDVLIDGPFIRELAGDFPLRGSSNQVMHLMTDRYTEVDFDRQVMELEIADDGLGVIGVGNLDACFAALSAMGVELE